MAREDRTTKDKDTHVVPVRTGRSSATADPPRANNGILWWLVLMEGLAAMFFGIIAVFWPGLTLVTLVYLFGAFVLVWGIIETIYGILSIRRRDTWWMTLFFGLVGLGVGIYLVRHPKVSFAALILIIGLTLIVRGMFDLVAAFMDKHRTAPRALLILVGIAALVAGVVLLFQPESAGVAFVWVLGLYAIINGTLMLAVAIEAREHAGRLTS